MLGCLDSLHIYDVFFQTPSRLFYPQNSLSSLNRIHYVNDSKNIQRMIRQLTFRFNVV